MDILIRRNAELIGTTYTYIRECPCGRQTREIYGPDCVHPTAAVFWVSYKDFSSNRYEIRPLTITSLIRGISKNFWWQTKLRLAYLYWWITRRYPEPGSYSKFLDR